MFFLYAIIFAEWWKSWGFFREKDESVCFRVLNMSKKINSKLNKKCSFESLGGGEIITWNQSEVHVDFWSFLFGMLWVLVAFCLYEKCYEKLESFSCPYC